MFRLVTQYTGKTFRNGAGYGGTSGGHCYHLIDCDNLQLVGGYNNGLLMSPEDWLSTEDKQDSPRHLNTFRLWFTYED